MSTTLPGSYTKSSRNVTYNDGNLEAQCQTVNGEWKSSKLQCDIVNMNGHLTPLPGGSYQVTSRNIHLENAADGVHLVAECQRRDGSWVKSSLKIADLANVDGVLKYSP